MTTKSLLLTGILLLASFSVINAKSYDLVFNNPVKAGNVDLRAGEYTLKVKDDTAVFTDVNTDKSYTAPVKIENAAQRHSATAVDSIEQNGTIQIQKIELGGSAKDITFLR
jgi:hypothetical protein